MNVTKTTLFSHFNTIKDEIVEHYADIRCPFILFAQKLAYHDDKYKIYFVITY